MAGSPSRATVGGSGADVNEVSAPRETGWAATNSGVLAGVGNDVSVPGV